MLINFPIGFFISTPPHAYTHCLTVDILEFLDILDENLEFRFLAFLD
jgi:hypothetical protein